MTIYHKHHIIPKHMGGTDDPSNLVELTVEEHAQAHKELFEKYGHKEDELAWKGLSAMLSKEEIIKTLLQENGRKTGKNNKNKTAWNKGKTVESDPRVAKYVEKNKGRKHQDTSKMGRYKRTPEIISKLKKPKSEETKQKIREKSLLQFSSEENRKKLSNILKNKRDTCVYCGLESNRSNIVRHMKKCSKIF
jgi:hypothetical protein